MGVDLNDIVVFDKFLDTKSLFLTGNTTTIYALALVDLAKDGPIVLEAPAGPTAGMVDDFWFRSVTEVGRTGPDAGKGGKHILVPPDFKGELPKEGYYVHRASSNRQIGGVRALPVNGDVAGAKALLKTVKVYPLDPKTPWTEPQWLDISDKEQVGCPVEYEDKFE